MSLSLLNQKHVYLESLGCSKNRVDSEIMLSVLNQKGCELLSEPQNAEIIILNTCAFLSSATEESIDRILELSDFKKSGVCEQLVVTGCLSQRYQEELLSEIPEIDGILGAHSFERIVELVEEIYADSEKPHAMLTKKPYYQHFALQERIQTTPRHFAYVKIAEGCSNMCSFCNIPFLRGHFSSRSIESVVTEIQYLLEKGVQEINLISQDTSSYGKDLDDNVSLAPLLKAISQLKGDFWVRMFYCYPNRLKEEVLEIMAEDSRFCRYLDMPFQHINNGVLKQMNRQITRQQIEKKMSLVERFLPDVAWRTTFIVGFPTETEVAFNELCDFVSTQRFHNLGVFAYSHENNAPASKRWEDLIPHNIKEERKQQIMTLQQSISLERNQERVGQKMKVLVDGISDESPLLLQGRNQYQGAEVDGIVYINEGEARPGTFHTVEITEATPYDLIGKILLSFFFIFLSSSLFFHSVQAQNLLIEEGQAAVRVYNENLVKAKARALKIAKRDLLTRSLSRFLAAKDIERLFPLLSRYLLDYPDKFIESIRIINESTPKDISTFFLTVEGQIFRSRMVSALKKLALPLKTEANETRTLEFSWNSQTVFGKAPNRNLILEQLKANFAPYQVMLQPAPKIEQNNTLFLSNPFLSQNKSQFSEFSDNQSFVLSSLTDSQASSSSSALPQVELTFQTRPQWRENFKVFPVTVGFRLKLYHPQDRSVLSNLYVQKTFQKGNLEEMAQSLFNELILQWSPIFHALSALDQREGVLSKIKLTGISNAQQEQYVMKRLFMNHPRWEQVSLKTLSDQSVVYEGKYSGPKKDEIERLLQWNERNFNENNSASRFRLQYVGWNNGTLLLHTAWKIIYAELEAYQPSFELEQQLIQAQESEMEPPLPTLQVPLTPSKSIYALPQDTYIYDHIKTRGDSTLFKVTIPPATQSLTLQWTRIGNTSLRPKITIYNSERMLHKEYRLGQRIIWSKRTPIPRGTQQILIGVSDEFGYVKDVVGGYQSFGYILRVGEPPSATPQL